MAHSIRKRSRFILPAALAVLGAALLASCGGDDSSAGGNAEVINAVSIMDKAGLHELDESINTKKEIPADAESTVRQLQAVTTLTKWPDSLQSQADALAKIFGEFAAAVAGEKPDIAKAGAASKKAHDAQHDFSHDVWMHLYEEAGMSGSGGDGH